jgi:hypothetical protein
MKRKHLLGFFILAAAFLTACEKKAEEVPAGTVKASSAYVEFFGEPPTPERGVCFARVGFYPLNIAPSKVRPVPFFLFREEGQPELLLQRLISGEVTFPEASPLVNPFPDSSRLQVRSLGDGLIELDLTLGTAVADETVLMPMAAALTETAVQFDEVSRVRLFLDGTAWPGMPAEGFAHDAQRIADPGAPTLLTVVGVWVRGAQDLEEILANFDRPVTIRRFVLRDAAGNDVQGAFYQSVFNMAVVLHPDKAAEFREGITLTAEWEVVDSLGRDGKGVDAFSLVRLEHP